MFRGSESKANHQFKNEEVNLWALPFLMSLWALPFLMFYDSVCVRDRTFPGNSDAVGWGGAWEFPLKKTSSGDYDAY